MKHFDEWNSIKKETEKILSLPSFQEREIWWIKLGDNVGHEECGKGDYFLRPFVIVKKYNDNLILGVPCSSTHKENKYYFKISIESNAFETSALISQIKVISSKRLLKKIARLGSGQFKKLKATLVSSF